MQSIAKIRPAGGLICGTCHDWHPTEDHIGSFGRLVNECSECRRIRDLKKRTRHADK